MRAAAPLSPSAVYDSAHQVMRCITDSVPQWTADCSSWTGTHVQNSVPEPAKQQCQLKAVDRATMIATLSNTIVIFFGDSTARRAARQLHAFLAGTQFADSKSPGTTVYRLSVAEARNITIISHWLPQIRAMQAALTGGDPEVWPELNDVARDLFGGALPWQRKLIVLQYSTWDLMGMWRNPTRLGAAAVRAITPQFIAAAVKTVSALLSNPAVDSCRDAVLFRLPIAQDCNVTRVPALACDPAHGGFPVNDFVAAAGEQLRAALASAFPTQLGLIDVFSWTAGPRGVGRHACAPADRQGTHFATEGARMAYIQQLVHAATLMWRLRADMEGCPPSLQQ